MWPFLRHLLAWSGVEPVASPFPPIHEAPYTTTSVSLLVDAATWSMMPRVQLEKELQALTDTYAPYARTSIAGGLEIVVGLDTEALMPLATPGLTPERVRAHTAWLSDMARTLPVPNGAQRVVWAVNPIPALDAVLKHDVATILKEPQTALLPKEDVRAACERQRPASWARTFIELMPAAPGDPTREERTLRVPGSYAPAHYATHAHLHEQGPLHVPTTALGKLWRHVLMENSRHRLILLCDRPDALLHALSFICGWERILVPPSTKTYTEACRRKHALWLTLDAHTVLNVTALAERVMDTALPRVWPTPATDRPLTMRERATLAADRLGTVCWLAQLAGPDEALGDALWQSLLGIVQRPGTPDFEPLRAGASRVPWSLSDAGGVPHAPLGFGNDGPTARTWLRRASSPWHNASDEALNQQLMDAHYAVHMALSVDALEANTMAQWGQYQCMPLAARFEVIIEPVTAQILAQTRSQRRALLVEDGMLVWTRPLEALPQEMTLGDASAAWNRFVERETEDSMDAVPFPTVDDPYYSPANRNPLHVSIHAWHDDIAAKHAAYRKDEAARSAPAKPRVLVTPVKSEVPTPPPPKTASLGSFFASLGVQRGRPMVQDEEEDATTLQQSLAALRITPATPELHVIRSAALRVLPGTASAYCAWWALHGWRSTAPPCSFTLRVSTGAKDVVLWLCDTHACRVRGPDCVHIMPEDPAWRACERCEMRFQRRPDHYVQGGYRGIDYCYWWRDHRHIPGAKPCAGPRTTYGKPNALQWRLCEAHTCPERGPTCIGWVAPPHGHMCLRCNDACPDPTRRLVNPRTPLAQALPAPPPPVPPPPPVVQVKSDPMEVEIKAEPVDDGSISCHWWNAYGGVPGATWCSGELIQQSLYNNRKTVWLCPAHTCTVRGEKCRVLTRIPRGKDCSWCKNHKLRGADDEESTL